MHKAATAACSHAAGHTRTRKGIVPPLWRPGDSQNRPHPLNRYLVRPCTRGDGGTGMRIFWLAAIMLASGSANAAAADLQSRVWTKAPAISDANYHWGGW